jgi:dolichol-phosphate mannosyltransferase
MNVVVVLPCYNVSAHIESVIRSLPPDVTSVIAVNDCSSDDTEQRLLRMQQDDRRIVYIRHDKNQGVGGAMITGYRKALELEADVIVKMDGDGQMDASRIHELVRPLSGERADFTKGNRFRDLKALRAMPLSRRFGNLGLSFMIKAASGYWNVFDPTNGFTAIRRETLRQIDLNKLHRRYYFETSLLTELYYTGAVIEDVSMPARYGDEISGLSRTRSLFEFPPKLCMAFLRRVILRYFLFDFNIASLYLVFGLPLFLAGAVYGAIQYIQYGSSHVAAPTGTVVIPTLLIILGFQLLLSAVQYDISHYPKR